jgi:hypothetical protein
MKKNWIMVSAFLGLALILTGCNSREEQVTSKKEEETTNEVPLINVREQPSSIELPIEDMITYEYKQRETMDTSTMDYDDYNPDFRTYFVGDVVNQLPFDAKITFLPIVEDFEGYDLNPEWGSPAVTNRANIYLKSKTNQVKEINVNSIGHISINYETYLYSTTTEKIDAVVNHNFYLSRK